MADSWGTMSVAVVRALLAALAGAGVDATVVARRHGITLEALADPEGRVPTRTAFELFDELPSLAGDEHFGLRAALATPLGTFEVLDHATRTSRTIGEGLLRMTRYFPLLHEASAISLDVVGDIARIAHRRSTQLGAHCGLLMLFAVVVDRGRQLTGVDWPMRVVRFAHKPPRDPSPVREFFRAPIAYEQPIDELVFDRAFLDVPLLTADPALSSILDRFADTLMAKLATPDPFVTHVRDAIARALPSGDAALEPVAARLGMSGRTLQRRLADHQSSHKELVESVRRELALHYLRDEQLSVEEVAYLLGFSAGTAFHRAFRRWTGRTPSEYRKGHGERESSAFAPSS